MNMAAADTLKFLASAHSNLEMFDEARNTSKQALDLTRRCNGEESTQVALCHQNMSDICQKQVDAIKAQVGVHMNYMLTNSKVLYHLPGSRVLVEGLQKKQQYNGIEGIVVEMDGPRMRIRLVMLDNKELMLKPENVCPLFPTALKLQEHFLKLHDRAQERIASCKEFHRIQIRVTGVKNINGASACQNLG